MDTFVTGVLTIVETSESASACLTLLPNELLYQIAGSLAISDLNKLAQTSKWFHEVMNNELYCREARDRDFHGLARASCSHKATALSTIKRFLQYCPCALLHKFTDVGLSYSGKSLTHLTPLEVAIQAGSLRVVKFLIKRDRRVVPRRNGPYDTRWSPIHHAMVMDYFRPGETVYTTRHKLAIVKLLLSSGADANQLSATRHPGNAIVGEGQVTPLHLAIKNKADSRVIQTLLEHGASATQIAYHTASPGQFYSTLSPISHLINAYPDLTEDQYRSASHLVNYGAGTGTESSMYTLSGNPLLVECLSQPRQSTWWTDMTKLLLSGGCANANDTSHRGQSAIVHYLTSHVGWEPSHPYERRFVLSHELRYEMSDTAEITCKNIRLLFQFGADINSTGVSDSFRETPLHVAAGLHENFHYIFDELVQYGADTKAVTADGRTILHTLVQGDRHANPTRLTHFIKKLRIPRNAVDADGNTFLHYLCTSNMCTSPRWYKEVVKNYTQKDYLIKNNANQTPVEMAKNNDDHMGMVVEGTIQSAFDELYGNRTSTASGFRSKNGVGREKHQTKGKGRQIN